MHFNFVAILLLPFFWVFDLFNKVHPPFQTLDPPLCALAEPTKTAVYTNYSALHDLDLDSLTPSWQQALYMEDHMQTLHKSSINISAAFIEVV